MGLERYSVGNMTLRHDGVVNQTALPPPDQSDWPTSGVLVEVDDARLSRVVPGIGDELAKTTGIRHEVERARESARGVSGAGADQLEPSSGLQE